jgi:hypothetical protein
MNQRFAMKAKIFSTKAPGGELAAGPSFRRNTQHWVDAAFNKRGIS